MTAHRNPSRIAPRPPSRTRALRSAWTSVPLALVTAVAAVVVALVGGPAADAVEVTPSSLPRGADPAVATLNWRTEVLRTPDGPLELSLPGRASDLVTAAAGRFVVTTYTARSARILVLGRRGEVTVLGRRLSSYEVSDNGRRVAFTLGFGARPTLKVVNVVTGRTLGTRKLTRYGSVGYLGARKVFLNIGEDVRTWRPGARTAPRLVRHASAVAGSEPAGLLSLVGTRRYPGCARVVQLDDPRQVLWRSCTKLVYSFSPDGSRGYALHPATDGYGPSRALAVDTADGTTLRRWTGSVFLREAWESDDDLLLTVHDIDADESAVVRCAITAGGCERAGRVHDADLDRPYAGVVWIPAR